MEKNFGLKLSIKQKWQQKNRLCLIDSVSSLSLKNFLNVSTVSKKNSKFIDRSHNPLSKQRNREEKHKMLL